MHQIAFLALIPIRVLQENAQAVHGVSQDDQSEQEVRNSLCRLPLELREEKVVVIIIITHYAFMSAYPPILALRNLSFTVS